MSILIGDCIESMRQMEAGSVQTCVTSPPYFGLRDYGHDGQIGLEATPEAFVAALLAVFREVRRVLADDGTLWLNLGDSYGPAKSLLGMPWRVALALQADGWVLRQDIIWSKPNPMPESVRDRCTKAHEYLFLLSKGPRYHFDAEAIAEPLGSASIARLAQAGLEDQAGSDRVPGKTNGAMKAVGRRAAGNKTHKQTAAYEAGDERLRTKAGLVDFAERERAKVEAGDLIGTRNKRSVWTVATMPFKEAHFATFPEALIEPCILAGAPAGTVVLDPFMGAGTTAVVCERLGRKWIGCELNPEYAAIAETRIRNVQPGFAFGAAA